MQELKTFKTNTDFISFDFVESLIYYDGDILSLYEDNGKHYLVQWYDVGEDFHRWLVVQINKEELYEKNLIKLLKEPLDSKWYILDSSYENNTYKIKEIKYEDLPSDIFCDKDCKLEKK